MLTLTLWAQILCRLILGWYDNAPKSVLIVWTIYAVYISVIALIAEFKSASKISTSFPLLALRAGRGATSIFLALPMFGADAASITLGSFVVLGGIINIVLGRKDKLTHAAQTELAQNNAPFSGEPVPAFGHDY